MTQLIDIFAPEQQDGTTSVVRNWFVSVGDQVAKEDPILELETDKVALEVPAPAAGIITEVLLEKDADASPGVLLGRIDPSHLATPTQHTQAPAEAAPIPKAQEPVKTGGGEHRLSPSVRRILTEAGITGENIIGTGRNGRITKADALAYVADIDNAAPQTTKPLVSPPPQKRPAPVTFEASNNLNAQMVPHSAMRRSIAKHMSHSVTTAPHVTAVFEADFGAIMAHRAKHKEAFKRQGISLTYTTYIVAACVEAMKAAPAINSRWHDDALEIFSDFNIGIGTALGDDGLVVPVVHHAQNLSLEGIAQRLQDVTSRARENKLTPKDTQGGTFTISNHGVSGSLVASPIIINQPQSAILGVGKLEKRVCVIEVDGVDSIQIRPKAFVSLTIDHRVLDGHQTNMWLTKFVEHIDNWPID